MDFLILYQANPSADFEVCGMALEKKKGQAEDAIREFTTKGEGTYFAVQFEDKTVTKKRAKLGIELAEVPTEEAEKEAAESNPPPISETT